MTTEPTTIYAQYRMAKQTSKVCDRMGNDLAVGDLITYILHNFQFAGACIFVGVITKISPRSRDVYARNIKMVEHELVEEKKIKEHVHILKITDELSRDILLKKLSQ